MNQKAVPKYSVRRNFNSTQRTRVAMRCWAWDDDDKDDAEDEDEDEHTMIMGSQHANIL